MYWGDNLSLIDNLRAPERVGGSDPDCTTGTAKFPPYSHDLDPIEPVWVAQDIHPGPGPGPAAHGAVMSPPSRVAQARSHRDASNWYHLALRIAILVQ